MVHPPTTNREAMPAIFNARQSRPPTRRPGRRSRTAPTPCCRRPRALACGRTAPWSRRPPRCGRRPPRCGCTARAPRRPARSADPRERAGPCTACPSVEHRPRGCRSPERVPPYGQYLISLPAIVFPAASSASTGLPRDGRFNELTAANPVLAISVYLPVQRGRPPPEPSQQEQTSGYGADRRPIERSQEYRHSARDQEGGGRLIPGTRGTRPKAVHHAPPAHGSPATIHP